MEIKHVHIDNGLLNKKVQITTFTCFNCKGILTKIENEKIFVGKRGFNIKNIKNIMEI